MSRHKLPASELVTINKLGRTGRTEPLLEMLTPRGRWAKPEIRSPFPR